VTVQLVNFSFKNILFNLKKMARDPKFVLEYLKQIEAIASEILNDRRDIIELNKKRDKTREASRLVK